MPVFPLAHVPLALQPLMQALAEAAIALAARIARNGVEEHLGAAAGTNSDGDSQKALDVISNDIVLNHLKDNPAVSILISEELDEAVVERSNRILARLRTAADASQRAAC